MARVEAFLDREEPPLREMLPDDSEMVVKITGTFVWPMGDGSAPETTSAAASKKDPAVVAVDDDGGVDATVVASSTNDPDHDASDVNVEMKDRSQTSEIKGEVGDEITSDMPDEAVTPVVKFPAVGFNVQASFNVPQNCLVAVIGHVGSGKSSLLSSLLGELDPAPGAENTNSQVLTVKNIAYVPQTAFVLSGTVRENIMMGLPYEEDHFEWCIFAAGMQRDIDIFPQGVSTEVGERGSTLSGGQQQRVGIARALYRRPRLMLMDDPLSAVDTAVANHIMKHAVLGSRDKGCAVVMSLNQLQLLQNFDRVIYMSEGTVTEEGPLQELMRDESSAISSFASKYQTAGGSVDELRMSEEEHEEKEAKLKEVDGGKKDEDAAPLVVDEKREQGAILAGTFHAYFTAMGYTWVMGVGILAVGTYVVFAFCDIFLARWVKNSSEGTLSDDENQNYAFIYIGACVAQLLLVLMVSSLNAIGSARASQSLHDDAMRHLLRAPMSWFEATPSGRIISRFSSDLSLIDQAFANFYDDLVHFSLILLALSVVMCVYVPQVTPLLCLGGIAHVYQVIAVDRANREAKRMMNNAMSPVMSNFADTMRGRTVIAAHSAHSHFHARHYAAITDYSRFNFASCTIINWGRLVSNGISFTISTATAVVIMVKRRDYEPTHAALAITYSFLFPYFLALTSFLISMVLTGATSLERLLQFSHLPQEPEWHQEQDPNQESWPSQGAIEFRDVTLSYRPELPPAVKGASFSILAGEKVGVVGRTGAGKSSLLVLLFRLNEATSGQIILDGRNIAQVGLKKLRRAMAVIPQEPLRLRGDIRHNLDPFGQYDASTLSTTIIDVGLVQVRGESVDAVLTTQVDSISVGESQLLSLARALLRRDQVKIVVMDEATSAIDVETDAQVQRVLSEQLSTQTRITIAHRLNTIISHKILVMADGAVAQFGYAKEMAQDESGQFAVMLSAMGPEAASQLMKGL